MIIKCLECGNTFKIEKVPNDNLVTCPVCETDYSVQIEDGKAKVTDFVYENEDFGEL
ncbi:MAG: hypothetical protein NWF00_05440 [Candidatus Bathyarchaeota archaeon]|nr:hypothetical protein [Candidatus Bathyarchaeota archaeon]